MLIQSKVPSLVMHIAVDDLNCQVRAKALQCLQEIIREAQLWEYLIKDENVYVSI